ncbi:Uncharacterised protein [Pseudomonas putida]|nr:Uncharacterised protein [Pseudomonas putida]
MLLLSPVTHWVTAEGVTPHSRAISFFSFLLCFIAAAIRSGLFILKY